MFFYLLVNSTGFLELNYNIPMTWVLWSFKLGTDKKARYRQVQTAITWVIQSTCQDEIPIEYLHSHENHFYI